MAIPPLSGGIAIVAPPHTLTHTGMISLAAQVARGRLRCLGPCEILRGRCVFHYYRTYYKAVRVGGEETGGHVL
jgi:hypothetical protein